MTEKIEIPMTGDRVSGYDLWGGFAELGLTACGKFMRETDEIIKAANGTYGSAEEAIGSLWDVIQAIRENAARALLAVEAEAKGIDDIEVILRDRAGE